MKRFTLLIFILISIHTMNNSYGDIISSLKEGDYNGLQARQQHEGEKIPDGIEGVYGFTLPNRPEMDSNCNSFEITIERLGKHRIMGIINGLYDLENLKYEGGFITFFAVAHEFTVCDPCDFTIEVNISNREYIVQYACRGHKPHEDHYGTAVK